MFARRRFESWEEGILFRFSWKEFRSKLVPLFIELNVKNFVRLVFQVLIFKYTGCFI